MSLDFVAPQPRPSTNDVAKGTTPLLNEGGATIRWLSMFVSRPLGGRACAQLMRHKLSAKVSCERAVDCQCDRLRNPRGTD